VFVLVVISAVTQFNLKGFVEAVALKGNENAQL
jgi:hypothetical protein